VTKRELILTTIRDAGLAGASLKELAEVVGWETRSVAGYVRGLISEKRKAGQRIEWYEANGVRYFRMQNDNSRNASKLRDDVLALLRVQNETVERLAHLTGQSDTAIKSVLRSLNEAAAVGRRPGGKWGVRGITKRIEREAPYGPWSQPAGSLSLSDIWKTPTRPGSTEAFTLPSGAKRDT
jgi:hypothetical protein